MNIFNNSKYTNTYFKIVNKRKSLPPADDVSTEIHHIIPRSVGGGDDSENLVKLTLREHFICHLLLPKMLKKKHHIHKMKAALAFMMIQRIDESSFKYHSRDYEKARLFNKTIISDALKERWENDPEYRQMMVDNATKRSEWTRTDEGRKHMSSIASGAWQDDRYRKKQKASRKAAGSKHAANMKAKWQDPEFRAMMKRKREERDADPEFRARNVAHLRKIAKARSSK